MTEPKTISVAPTGIAPDVVIGNAAGSPPAFSTPSYGESPPANTTGGFLDISADAAEARDRRNSAEWDASKVPPSRFQKRKGSIYSTPNSRDGHVASNYAAKFHAKHAELGYNKK